MLNREQIIEITIAIAGSIVLGWLVKGLIFPYLYKLTRKTKWKSDDLVIDSIGKWVIFWFFLGACYYVLPIFTTEYPIVNKYESILEDLLGSLFIFSLTVVFAKVIAGMLKIRSVNDNSEIPSSSILGNIVKIIIYILGFILILHNFGVAIAPMVTALAWEDWQLHWLYNLPFLIYFPDCRSLHQANSISAILYSWKPVKKVLFGISPGETQPSKLLKIILLLYQTANWLILSLKIFILSIKRPLIL
jgi:hypothetical protein